MCKYCEVNTDGDYETWVSPVMECTRGYLTRYNSDEWMMTIVFDDPEHYNVTEIDINNCPWCGRDLD